MRYTVSVLRNGEVRSMVSQLYQLLSSEVWMLFRSVVSIGPIEVKRIKLS